MKYLLLFLFSITQALALDTYMYEWNSHASVQSIEKAQKVLKKNRVSLDRSNWNAQLDQKVVKELIKTKAFLYLEKDSITQLNHPKETPMNYKGNLSNWSSGWHLDRVHAKKAWGTTIGTGITVAICDSGIKADHPNLLGRVLVGKDFLVPEESTDTTPNTNHGTAVAGFLASNSSQLFGINGVAPGVSILPGRIVTKTGGVPISAMLACVRWAADQGAKVINVSMTGVNSLSSHSAAKYAWRKGSLVFWAAGNQNWSTRWRDKKEIIAVGATDINNKRYYFEKTTGEGEERETKRWGSNTGYFIDITAPGEDVYTMRTNYTYSRGNGTSYSSPIAAGVAALVYSIDASFTPNDVLNILKKSAKQMNNRRFYGSGMVNAEAAVQKALNNYPQKVLEFELRKDISINL